MLCSDPGLLLDDPEDGYLYGLMSSLLSGPDHDPDLSKNPLAEGELLSQRDMLAQAHGGRSAHMGARRTREILNEHFPGHGITDEAINEYRAQCPSCQKTDAAFTEKLYAQVRNIKTSDPSHTIGCDYLSLPLDKYGHCGAYVLRNHFTRLLGIFPTARKDATACALALFSFFVTYGAPTTLATDPGSDFMSDAIAQLNEWFGIHHKVSLVDRHESNGVEGANKQIIRHLTTLLLDERIKDVWSSPLLSSGLSSFATSLMLTSQAWMPTL
jgi:hypothetical protein